MSKIKKNRSIALDMEVIEAIKKLSKEEERSFSNYVNSILKKHIKELKKEK